MDESNYYRIDELENAVDYLETTLIYLKDTEHPHRFKWLMISLHGALYGFGVLAIKGTDPTATVYKSLNRSMKKHEIETVYKITKEKYEYMGIDYTEDDLKKVALRENGQLEGIWSILERTQMKEYMNKEFERSNTLILTDKQESAISKMIDYRNQFMHFIPMAMGFMGDYEKEIVNPVLEVIEFLALESGNILYYQNSENKVEQIFEEINTLKSQ
ncbi:hypothetical protein [Alteribacillus sp. YIM 98480]|uniref:hypothetical protein n=1 Tax=Alteribacillus sp. YIM 98480 TaxID=2606599 RepID=UPI00131EBE77|nr:hypothetical protein [Alteribacillus sp. YIM 98480]